jgi:nucleoside-diphosphate-sugar epimerase
LKEVAFNYDGLNGKDILITGGLGFIGSNIAHRCVQLGAKVTLLDACLEPYGWNYANVDGISESVEIVEGDVRDFHLMEDLVTGKEIVFSYGWPGGKRNLHGKPDVGHGDQLCWDDQSTGSVS